MDLFNINPRSLSSVVVSVNSESIIFYVFVFPNVHVVYMYLHWISSRQFYYAITLAALHSWFSSLQPGRTTHHHQNFVTSLVTLFPGILHIFLNSIDLLVEFTHDLSSSARTSHLLSSSVSYFLDHLLSHVTTVFYAVAVSFLSKLLVWSFVKSLWETQAEYISQTTLMLTVQTDPPVSRAFEWKYITVSYYSFCLLGLSFIP